MYRNCEAFIGEAFGGRLPAGVKMHHQAPAGHARAAARPPAVLAASLDASLAAMRLERVDLFFLHSNMHADGFAYAHGDDSRDRFSTAWSVYVDEVRPGHGAAEGRGPDRRLGDHRHRRADRRARGPRTTRRGPTPSRPSPT